MTGVFEGKVFLLVTGASRGIGKQIAITFASHLGNGSHVLLLARNSDNLKKTVDAFSKNIIASSESVDFSNTTTDKLQEIVGRSLGNEKAENFNQAIIVHCAATANFSQLTIEMTDFDEWHKSYDLNVFSPAVLNGIFMKTFKNRNIKKFVINISSYWGLNPEKFVGSYCSAKSAKDMFFKVFALENPHVNVLNYLPGYVGTDMFNDVLKTSKNEELKKSIEGLVANKKFITPDQTATYLVKILKEQKYKSGDIVDYNNQV